jgi:sugar O-acyltransferase (sialic acid O-acetyltransferase NeuD family)
VKADILAVFGSGGHAKVIIEAVLARAPDRKIVILDDRPEAQGRELLGISVSGGREKLADLPGATVVLGVGDNRSRAELMDWLSAHGHELETVIHPTATIGKTVSIAPGAFIAAGSILIADASIEAGAIINTGATVDHDCVIGAAAHIAPGVSLCGNVSVGERTLVGVGSCARPGVTIGKDIVIGAGSVVIRDLIEPGTYVGNPARRQA